MRALRRLPVETTEADDAVPANGSEVAAHSDQPGLARPADNVVTAERGSRTGRTGEGVADTMSDPSRNLPQHSSARELAVDVRRRAGSNVLEVSALTGGVLGHFDPDTGQLHVIDAQDSVAVAAAVAPYLLGSGRPLGVLSVRHIAAAQTLWAILEASPYTWQRSVPLRERLLHFYCPLVRLTLEIVDDGQLRENVDAPALRQLGLGLAVIPLRELEERPEAVAAWLGGVCTRRADNRPGAQPDVDRRRRRSLHGRPPR